MVLKILISLSVVMLCAAPASQSSLTERAGLQERPAKSPSAPTLSARGRTGRGEQKKRHPVILVPGLGGSQLWAKLNKPAHSPHFYCSKHTRDFYSIWVSFTQLAPLVVDCWMDNIRLHYDRATHTTHNTQGVDIQALHFGDPRSVEYLNPFFGRNDWDNTTIPTPSHQSHRRRRRGIRSAFSSLRYVSERLPQYVERVTAARLLGRDQEQEQWLPPDTQRNTGNTGNRGNTGNAGNAGNTGNTGNRSALLKGLHFPEWAEPVLPFTPLDTLSYFSAMTNQLMSRGYTRGKDLRAAPYDFRKAPNEMADFFNNTKKLIEDTYTKNGNTPVLMVAHSMGNPVMLYFYNHVVSRQWKDKYIRSHVALAAPWGGSMKALKLMVSGDTMGLPVKRTEMRSVERSMVSTAWLLPSPHLWPQDQVLVTTSRRNYTVTQYQQLFTDLRYDDGFRMWQDTAHLIQGLQFPEVELHCLHGISVKTPGRLVYEKNNFPDKAPKVVMDDGDGTVNRLSLEAFRPWTQQQHPHLIKHLQLDKVGHNGILKDKRVIQYVLNLASP